MEHKKKVTVLGGQPGKNKAEVTVEEKDASTEHAQYAKSLIASAASHLSPIGADYLGSAVIHYYSQEPLPSNPTFFTIVQLDLKKVEEQLADLGWKELRAAMMKSYGREEPKTRNT